MAQGRKRCMVAARSLIGVCLVILLAACGAQPAAPTSAPTQAPATSPPAEPTPVQARTISHALGETELPANPQRVVALEWTYVEDLLALGVQPVGVADIAGYNDWVNIPVALDESVVDVGTRQEPNLEAIAQLDPDLIITVAFRAEPIYDQLSAIAPTLVFDPYPTDESITQYDEMRQTLMTIAEAVGREERGTEVLAQLDARIAEARGTLESAGLAGAPFVLAQAYTSGEAAEVRLFTDNAMATQILEQIGLVNAWDDGFQQYGFTTVGIEALRDLGDPYFLYVVQDDDNVFASGAAAQVWESLAFVRADRAISLGGDTWLFGGPLSAEVLIDGVVEALAQQGAASSGEGRGAGS